MTAETAILLTDESGASPDTSLLRQALESGLRVHGREDAEVSVLLCDDATIQALNRDWRGIDEPTDVLSFPAGDFMCAEGMPLGDIAIAVPYSALQAEKRGVALELELAYLGVHGLLHLLGMNDETDEERDAMIAAMNRVMREAGLPEDDYWGTLK